jgi:hypothetical protein
MFVVAQQRMKGAMEIMHKALMLSVSTVELPKKVVA